MVNKNRYKNRFMEKKQELSPLQKKYRKFFRDTMEKFNVDNLHDMDDVTMIKFFKYIKDNWAKVK